MPKYVMNPIGIVIIAIGMVILLSGVFGINLTSGATVRIASSNYTTITVNPGTVSVGGAVQLSGSGFTPNGYLNLYLLRVFDGRPWLPNIAYPLHYPLDGNGAFSVTLSAAYDPSCPSQCQIQAIGIDSNQTQSVTFFTIVSTQTVTYPVAISVTDCNGAYISAGTVELQDTGSTTQAPITTTSTIPTAFFPNVLGGTYPVLFNGAAIGVIDVNSNIGVNLQFCTSTTTSQATTTQSNTYMFSTTTVSTTSVQYLPFITVTPTQLTVKPGSLQTFTVTGSNFPANGLVAVYFNGPTTFTLIGSVNGGSFTITGQGKVLSGTYSVYAFQAIPFQRTYTETSTYTTTIGNIVQINEVDTVVTVTGYENVQSNSVLIGVNSNAAGLPLAHVTIIPSDVVSRSGQLSVTGYGFSATNTVTLYFSNSYYQSSKQFTTDSDGYFTGTILMGPFTPGTYNVYIVDSLTGFQIGPYQIIVTGGTGAPTFTVNLPGQTTYYSTTIKQTTTAPNSQTFTVTTTSQLQQSFTTVQQTTTNQNGQTVTVITTSQIPPGGAGGVLGLTAQELEVGIGAVVALFGGLVSAMPRPKNIR
jgi:hypothetical protein